MKKILSLLICLCMVISMLPVFTVSAEEPTETVWHAAIGVEPTPGTLIADYSFADGDVPGKSVPNNFPTDATDPSKEYVAEYTSEGFKITKLQDGTTDNSGTLTSYNGRINFVKITDEATKSYETGFRGTYVVDMLINANMKKPAANTAKNPPRFDMWFGYNEDITANKNTANENGIRYVSGNILSLYDNKTSGSVEYKDGGIRGVTTPGEDTVHRFVFDTENKKIAHYMSKDGAFVYVGSGEFFGEAVQGIKFTPRLGFEKDSYFTFKNIKIYEVSKAQEPLIKVVNAPVTPDPEPDTPDPEPDTPDPEPTPDPDNKIPDWVELIGANATPGSLIADYGFANGEVPGKNIPNNFNTDATDATKEYTGEYTSEGFKITRLQDGTDATASSSSGYAGRINFVSVTDEATNSYESGFRGTYVVDFTIKADMSKPAGMTKNARFDMSFGYNEDITSYKNVNTDPKSWNNMRFMQDNTWRLYDNQSSATEYFESGADRLANKGEDTTFRFVFDTVNKNIAFYKLTENGYGYIGSGELFGDCVQGITFTPRLAFKKDSYFIFKNVKIYEVVRAEEPLIKVVNTPVTPDPDPEPDTPDPDDNIPDWVVGFGANKTPGTLVDSHGFSDSNVPGRKVYNSYTDSTNFSGEYTADGFVLKRATPFVSGTGRNPSNEYMRINLTKKVGDEYKYGLKGTYAIDLTVNGRLKSSQSQSDVYLDGYIVDSDNAELLSTSDNANVKIRFIAEQGRTGNTHFQVVSASDATQKTELMPIPVNEDTVIRLIVDSETGNIAAYSSEDNKETFKYYGSIDGVFKGNKIQAFIFNPGLGLIESSTTTMAFKNIDIYEITAVEDSQGPDTPEPEPGDDVIVADPTNKIPDWAEVIGLTAEPGKKVGDYKITGNDIPGEYIPNTFGNSADFSGEYTEDGFVMKKLTEPAEADRAVSSGFGGVLHLVTNLEEDTVNKTKSYQHGLVGTYVVDLYVNSNLSMKISGAAARFDWEIGYQTSMTTADVAAHFNTIRVTSANAFTVYGSGSYTTGDDKMPKGQDTIVRLVFDTKNKQMAYFIHKNGGFVFSGNGAYNGDIIQSLYFTPRLGFAKDSTFTFKGVKIYEIERYINPELGIADRNFAIDSAMADENIMPKNLGTNPGAVTENITLPSGSWTTSNNNVVSATGVVKRGYDDEKVSLTNKYKTASTPSLQLFKLYELNVLKRTDVVNEILLDKDVNTAVDNYEMAVSRVLATDTYSKTYVNNLKGVYDFEFKVKPTVTNDATPHKIEVGYKSDAGYTNYVTADIYSDAVKYYTNVSSKRTSAVNNGNSNVINFRVDTVNKKIWVYVNGIKSNEIEYTGNDFVNAFKLTSNGTDSFVFETVNVTSLFAFDNEEFSDANIVECYGKAPSLTISDVTLNPEDAYGAMGSLRETLNGYAIKWSADSDYVDIAGKYIYRSDKDQYVTVTAKIYDTENPDVCIFKSFDIKVAKTTDPKLLLEGSTSKLAAKFITNQPADALIADIDLPLNVAGNTVSWEVTKGNALTKKGKINTNKDIASPESVTLTATVTNGVATVTKDVEFKVAKRGGDVTVYTNSADIETPIKGVVTYSADVNGIATLTDSNGKKIIELDTTGNVKVVMDFNNKKVVVFKNGVVAEDYIDFAEDAENFATVNGAVSNEKIILDEYALYDYNIDKFGYLDTIGKNVITSDVEMSKNSFGGVKVDWNSKNTSILSNEGKYNAPSNVVTLDVDFSLTLPGGTGAKYAKTIKVVAIPKNNIFKGATAVNQGTSVPAGEYQNAAMFDGDFTDTMFRGAYVNETKSIVIDMLNVQDINTLFVNHKGLKSFKLYVSDDKTNWNLVASPVFDGTLESNIITFNKENVRYVKIDTITYDGSYVDIYEIAGFAVYNSSDKSYMDIMAIGMPDDFVLTATSLNLPVTGSIYGSRFVWTSSHPDVISTNGTIKKPKNNTEVLLTVTSTNGDATSTMTFRYYVKGTNGAQGGIPSGGSGGGGGGGAIFVGNTSSSAFPETNTTVQTPVEYENKIFNDVTTEDWFYKYVLDLKNANIINGDDAGDFNPDKFVTREEFVKMIVNAADVQIVENGNGFVDVKSTDWFAPYVYAAKENGIVNGINANEFGVGYAISRQDMSVIIDNILDIEADISTNRDVFTDDSAISSYAYEAVYSIKALGIINGYDSGEFDPKGQLTRAEAAKVISMVMDIIK